MFRNTIYYEWWEAFCIRFLHVLHATSFRKRPGLCPPQCSEGHTYKFPCRARIRKPVKSNVGAYRDKPKFTGFTTIKDVPTGDRRRGFRD